MAGKKRVLDIELDGDAKAQFLEIKRVKGLTDDAKVLRLIINEYFEKKRRKEAGL
jgi:hypothetical protein